MREYSGRRDGGVLPIVLLLVVVVGISLALMRRQTASAREDNTVHTAGAVTAVRLHSELPDPRLATPLRVTIVRDPESDSWHGSASVLDSAAARWGRHLDAMGAQWQVSAPAALLTDDADVLVVAASPCVGRQLRTAVERALAAGRGVVVTGATGTHGDGCAQAGYHFLVSLTGATRLDTLDTRDVLYVTLPAGSPLATDIPPGARVEIPPGPYISLRALSRDAYYSDYSLNPAPAGNQPLLDAAILRNQIGGGRVVYWGFDLPATTPPTPWDESVLALLVRNSVAWAGGELLPELAAWPHGKDAAAVLAQDVEDEFEKARHAMDSLRAAGAPATYFLVTDLALRNKDLVRELAQHGEIGSHSENHEVLGGGSEGHQLDRLQLTQDHLVDILGERGKGFRPPEEQFDSLTLASWIRAGGSYFFSANDSRVAAPELIRVDGGTIVVLGRTSDDDYATVRLAGITEPDSLARIYMQGYEKARALGGLYMFSYHSNLLARPEVVPALATVAREIVADTGTWLTTAGEIAEWWRARSAVTISATRSGDGIDVELSSTGTTSVRDAVLRLSIANGERATSTSGGTLLESQPGQVRVLIPVVEPGAGVRIRITLAPSSGNRVSSGVNDVP